MRPVFLLLTLCWCHAESPPTIANIPLPAPVVEDAAIVEASAPRREVEASVAPPNGDPKCYDGALFTIAAAIHAEAGASTIQELSALKQCADAELCTLASSLATQRSKTLERARKIVAERADACGISYAELTAPARVDPNVIQKTVRAKFDRMRACYERGLQRNPKLEGRVVVRFVLMNRSGIVAYSSDISDGSDAGAPLGDLETRTCVVDEFRKIGFDLPELQRHGITSVVYPIVFAPD